MADDDKLARIVEARQKLRARFQAESHATPSMADPQPLGSGPPNRHGMPRLPVDQVESKKWPVLDLGAQPQVAPWRGVRVADAIAQVEPHDDARFVMFHGYDGYTTNVPLAEAVKPDVLLVHTADGKPLTVEHGGPVRVITPQLYAWKGAKWVSRIELMTADRRGFWEERGYSNTAYPWRNDRYS